MGDYVLVLNAGSSSLKFSVYRRSDSHALELDARGQIDGIGTAPRFTARQGDGGAAIKNEGLNAAVRDAPSALEHLAGWLRSRYAGAQVLGVGHRVVHGGPRYTQPVLVTPAVLDDLRELVPLAPLHQPHNLAAIEAVSERLQGVPQVACFDTSFHRAQPAVAELVPLPRDLCANGHPAIRVPRLVVRVRRGDAAEGGARDRRRPRDRRASRQRRQSVRAREREEHRQHARLHGARWPVHGHPARCARSRSGALPVPGDGQVGGRGREDSLQGVRPAGHFGHQQRHARPARESGARGAGSRWTTSSTARHGRSAG